VQGTQYEIEKLASKTFPNKTRNSYTFVANWSRSVVNADLVMTILEYASHIPSVQSIGLEGNIGRYIVDGFQRMGVYKRDRDLSDRAQRSRHYDVSFKEMEKFLEYHIGDQKGNTKLYPHMMSFLNKAKNVELPVVSDPKNRPENNILIHKKVGTKRNPVWRAGSTIVYWQVLFDIYDPKAKKDFLCACPSCLLLTKKTFPVESHEDEKDEREESNDDSTETAPNEKDENTGSKDPTNSDSDDDMDKKPRALGKRKRG
jgi:hypothetical protein